MRQDRKRRHAESDPDESCERRCSDTGRAGLRPDQSEPDPQRSGHDEHRTAQHHNVGPHRLEMLERERKPHPEDEQGDGHLRQCVHKRHDACIEKPAPRPRRHDARQGGPERHPGGELTDYPGLSDPPSSPARSRGGEDDKSQCQQHPPDEAFMP
ncbi:MAG: hypothetical protein HOQ24_09490 [Mycobacteriaceae bacterium]|nr:hypothetical protein [Mycobacteriaceae bacterium]